MKSYWDQLKPLEKRYAVFGGMLVFLMFNYFAVWPHFKDWTADNVRIEKAEKQIAIYQDEIRHKPEYQRKINDLQADGTTSVPEEDQAIDFVRFLTGRAVNNQVVISSQGTLVTRTNDFFLEQQMGISVQATETNLVNFLYSLGAGNSMMRVRAMNLHPDPSHQQLTAGITIVASYQKKTKMRSGAITGAAAASSAAKPAMPAPKPVTVAETKPKPAAPPSVAPAANPAPGGLPTITNKLAGALARRNKTNQPPPLTAPKP